MDKFHGKQAQSGPAVGFSVQLKIIEWKLVEKCIKKHRAKSAFQACCTFLHSFRQWHCTYNVNSIEKLPHCRGREVVKKRESKNTEMKHDIFGI